MAAVAGAAARSTRRSVRAGPARGRPAHQGGDRPRGNRSRVARDRRGRGAIVGHLALFEMTSSIPNRRFADGLRRLGLRGDATLFFDEHVEADAVHENVAAVDLAGGLVRQDPSQYKSVLWGARTLSLLGQRWASGLLTCWSNGRSSLLGELQAEALELTGAVGG